MKQNLEKSFDWEIPYGQDISDACIIDPRGKEDC